MTAHLFAYGTLMSAATGRLGAAQRARLQREAHRLGAATLAGRVYDLGRYPGLCEPAGPSDIVHGEVFHLLDPAASLRWLDAYEGIVPGEHDHNQYVRLVRSATLASGGIVDAWVYLLTRMPADRQLIDSGRWSAED